MDGVLWRDTESIGNLPAIFETLKAKNIQFVFATNNATRTVKDYQQKLMGMGIVASEDQIINSAMAVRYILQESYPDGGPLYVIGERGLKECLQEAGFYEDDKDPLAVVVGLDREITYEKLAKATLLIRSGKRFIGSNPDLTYPMPEGLVPGAGAIISTVALSCDQEPEYAGKPAATMFRLALEKLKTTADETMAVGDRLETDLEGGQRAGMRTAVVLSGVATQEDINKWLPAPDLVAKDLTELVNML